MCSCFDWARCSLEPRQFYAAPSWSPNSEIPKQTGGFEQIPFFTTPELEEQAASTSTSKACSRLASQHSDPISAGNHNNSPVLSVWACGHAQGICASLESKQQGS